MPAQSITDLLNGYTTALPDNTSGLISPQDLRDSLTDTVLSIQAADAVLAGVAGGQTLNGGTQAGETLTLRGTSHAGNGTKNKSPGFYA
jgi:hypothetical protein